MLRLFSGGRVKKAKDSAVLDALDRSMAAIHFKPTGEILWANANFCGAMGYELEEIVGQHHSIFAEPHYKDTYDYKLFWERLGNGESFTSEYTRIKKNGKKIYIQASYMPVLDSRGKVERVIKYASDVTIPKLKGREALDRTQAVISFDLQGNILEANDNFCNAMGYRLEEIVGQHHSIFADPEYAASPDYKLFWENLRNGEHNAGEFCRFSKTGKPVWISASYSPVFDQSGNPISIIKYATDITEKKQIEAETQEVSSSVAAATEEMSSSINDISRNMAKTQEQVTGAVGTCHEAETVLTELAKSAQNMGEIVNIIADINGQIDLLALNAAIEAARAGEAGRGFAVVADEVKKLANNTTKSTQRINEEIKAVQEWSAKVGTTLEEIIRVVEDTNQSTSTVAAATEQQASVINDISQQVGVLRNLVIRH